MTSSALETSNKPGSKTFETFRKAGNMFGLDLAGLFEDEEEGSGSIPEGFAPAFKITSQLKGRSPGTLAYKATKTPSRTAEFSLGPKPSDLGDVTISANFPAPSSAPQQTETKKPELLPQVPQTPISIEYGASPSRFGHEDYWQNLAKGASPEQLKQYVQQNVGLLSEGNRPGGGGLYDEIMSGKVRTNWDQPAAGAPDVSSGSAAAQYATQFAAANPGPQEAGPVTSAGSVNTGAGASASAFGHADVAAARARGASTQEILSFVNANQGLLRGGNVPGGGGLYDQLMRGQI